MCWHLVKYADPIESHKLGNKHNTDTKSQVHIHIKNAKI